MINYKTDAETGGYTETGHNKKTKMFTVRAQCKHARAYTELIYHRVYNRNVDVIKIPVAVYQ